VLVEGASDKAAVETVARRIGFDLTSVDVVAMGGITNVGRYVNELGPRGRNLRLTGLCDANEQSFVVRAMRRSGFEDAGTDNLESHGFFTCVRDLEDEFIRAVGVDPVQDLLRSTNELASFRLFQRQPAQRHVAIHDQLHRFLGTRATRKIRFGHLMADAVPLESVPRPVARLLETVRGTS